MTRADDRGQTDPDWEKEMEALLARMVEANLITKFVVLAEVIGEDGSRWMHSVSSEHCYEWDQLGLMESHKTFLVSRNVASRMEGE